MRCGCESGVSTSATGDDRSFIYAFDGQGHVTQLIETTAGANTGTVAASYAYDAFGNITSKSGGYADANPFCFSTKYFDAETGLSYYGYRYYSARLGRWLSRDPIGEAGGVNLYAFVLNSPLNLFEPLGLFPDGLGDEFDKCIADLKNQRIRRLAALQDMCAPLDHAAAACHGAAEGACQGGVDVAVGAKDAAVEVGAIGVDTGALAGVNACYDATGIHLPYEPLSSYCQSLDEAGDRCFEVGAEAGEEVVKNGLTCGVWGLAEGLNRVDIDDPASVQQFCRQQGGGALFGLATLEMAEQLRRGLSNCGDAAAGAAARNCAHPHSHGFAIRDINPTGGTLNCGNCALATDSLLAGNPVCAVPGGPVLTTELSRACGVFLGGADFRSRASDVS